jgi:hypothetical protein
MVRSVIVAKHLSVVAVKILKTIASPQDRIIPAVGPDENVQP